MHRIIRGMKSVDKGIEEFGKLSPIELINLLGVDPIEIAPGLLIIVDDNGNLRKIRGYMPRTKTNESFKGKLLYIVTEEQAAELRKQVPVPLPTKPGEEINITHRFLMSMLRHGGITSPNMIRTENAMKPTTFYRTRDELLAENRIKVIGYGALQYTPTTKEVAAARNLLAMLAMGLNVFTGANASIYSPAAEDIEFAKAVIDYVDNPPTA